MAVGTAPKKVTKKSPAKSSGSDPAKVTSRAGADRLKAKSVGSKPGVKRPRKAKPTAEETIRSSALKAAEYALEKKATDVHLLDLRKLTSMTDFFVIATADSDKQVKAVAENVISSMRDFEGVAPWHSEGWDSLRWVIIDFVDFVVHVFHSEARLYYNLERLWGDAPTEQIKDKLKPSPRRPRKAGPAEEQSRKQTAPVTRIIRSSD